MARKTNPNILRLGKTKEWNSKYIEKKSNELSSYVFNNLEIQKFIYKFFNQSGLAVDSCKLSHSENFLHIFIIYFFSPKTQQLIIRSNNHQKIRLALKKKSIKFLKKKSNINKNILKYKLYNIKYYNKKFQKFFIYKNKKFRRLKAIQLYKAYHNIKIYKNIINIKDDLFLKKIFESLYLFTNKKINIRLTLKNINNDNEIIKTFSKKKKCSMSSNLIKLRKFKKTEFFKIGIGLLSSSTFNSKNSELLSKYIAFYFTILKRHKFFLNFLKITLKIFLKKYFSRLKRIKILIKGRFDGSPRAKTNLLIVGIPPSLTLNCNINYAESTSFTANGTLGIKVWTYS